MKDKDENYGNKETKGKKYIIFVGLAADTTNVYKYNRSI
jgi:hypothetical protein